MQISQKMHAQKLYFVKKMLTLKILMDNFWGVWGPVFEKSKNLTHSEPRFDELCVFLFFQYTDLSVCVLFSCELFLISA